MFIQASQSTLKQMLYVGLKWVNNYTLTEFVATAKISESRSFLTCQFLDKLETLNNYLPFPVENVVIEIDFLTKRIYFRFYMQG